MQIFEWHCYNKSVSGALYTARRQVNLPENMCIKTVLSLISGGKHAVTGFPWPKLEMNSRDAADGNARNEE